MSSILLAKRLRVKEVVCGDDVGRGASEAFVWVYIPNPTVFRHLTYFQSLKTARKSKLNSSEELSNVHVWVHVWDWSCRDQIPNFEAVNLVGNKPNFGLGERASTGLKLMDMDVDPFPAACSVARLTAGGCIASLEELKRSAMCFTQAGPLFSVRWNC
jgi:hypothetical protein